MKLFFIYGIQNKNDVDHALELRFDHKNNFKLIDYPDLGGEMYRCMVYYPFVTFSLKTKYPDSKNRNIEQ